MANEPQVKTPQLQAPWAMEGTAVLEAIETARSGLTTSEAESRLSQYGPNALPDNDEKVTFIGSLQSTFNDKLPIMLLISAGISGLIGLFMHDADRFKDVASLAIILFSMAISNYILDKQAEKGVQALKKNLQKNCMVYRDGVSLEIPMYQITVGDVIFLKEGDLVPADCRVLKATNASTNEAGLTGESEQIEKRTATVSFDAELARRSSMIYMGTFVSSGEMEAVVVNIATETELGKIAKEVEEAEDTLTPLQRQLDQLGSWLLTGTLIVCGLVAVVFVWRDWSVYTAAYNAIREVGLIKAGPEIGEALTSLAEVFTTAVSLAIAFIPEALATVIVLALNIGVKEMVKEGAVVKNSRAGEAMGSVTMFCSDKTGTLTTGDMSVVKFWVPGMGFVEKARVLTDKAFAEMVHVMGYANNNADPTEKALAAFVSGAGLVVGDETKKTRLVDIPFTSARKRMSTLVSNGGLTFMTKGAPDVVLSLCSNLQGTTEEDVRAVVDNLSGQGYRVLVLASRPAESDKDIDEKNLTLLGLVALIDPPRPEVPETIKTIKAAGVTPIMITGDNGLTAQTIARLIGILPENSTPDMIMAGQELDRLVDGDIDAVPQATLERVARVRVFYRVSPTNKKQIVMVLQRLGNIVAMTGDGVNDAPALKQADVGVAIDDKATQVTKDVADIILKNGYAAIAPAIRVGRTILMRTRLYTHALLSTNMSEVGIFIVAAAMGWMAPLTSVMLLVINFLGDGWLSIALATEPSEKDVMTQKPRPSDEAVITPYMWVSMAIQGVIVTTLLSFIFIYAGTFGTETMGLTGIALLRFQQSITFAAFLVQKVARSSFTARSLRYNIWEIGFFSNVWTLLAGLTTAVMGICFLEIPVVSNFLGMTAVPTALVPYVFGAGLIPPAVEELVKFLRKK